MAKKAQDRRVTYFVVQPFVKTPEGILPESAIEARSEDGAKRQAERLAGRKAGVVAYSRTGDPQLGEFDGPVVLAEFGKVPPNLLELLGA